MSPSNAPPRCPHAECGPGQEAHQGVEEEEPDQGPPQGAHGPAAGGLQTDKVDRLVHMHLAVPVADDDTGILQADQVLLLQGLQFIEHLVSGVLAWKGPNHQIAHGLPP